MARAIALPFNRDEGPVSGRDDASLSGSVNLEGFVTGVADLLPPGEEDTRPWDNIFPTKIRDLLLFFTQDLAGRYGALFLSSWYSSKIVSTNSRVIITPARLQRSTMSCRRTLGSVMSSSNVAILCRLVA
jgi:hypothetical protein